LAIAIDNVGSKWIGTSGGGLVKFDGVSWTVYNTLNSGLPDNDINALAIDNAGNKWIGTCSGGLAKFDGVNWTVYDTSNSGLPNDWVNAIAIDNSGNKWIGTYGGGLVKFDGENWTVYNTSNSGLPSNFVWAIVIDNAGNKWIGTYDGGLAVYSEGGVILDVKGENRVEIPTKFALYQNYPNPLNPATKIKYTVPEESFVKISIHDVLGKEIATLVNERKLAGSYELEFNASNLTSGVYFYTMKAGNFIETRKMVLIK
jgi:sugar lactone lactonase YvrE